MNGLVFPSATQTLLAIISEHPDNPAQAVDKYLQKFGTQCAQKFLTSLTSAPDLFPEEDLLERMREVQQ